MSERTARRPVSMGDVARRAGVSAQTVSRVANGHENVVASTRAAVVAAMEELGYRPNSAARALKRGEFRTLGVVVFTLATWGNQRTVEAVATAAARHGYAITLLPVAARTEEGVRGAVDRLGELAVDGVVVVLEAHLLGDASVRLPPGVPVVVADSDSGSVHPVVDSDQADGARQAVEHLLALGHATVWHVAGPAGSYAAERREGAWRAALGDRPVPRVLRGDWTSASGRRAGLTLAREKRCSAVFVANDQMALGVLRAFHETGRRVPDDVSVVGFDDLPDAEDYWPPLTTVRQDFAEVGRRCVETLLASIRGEAPHAGTTLVPTGLVVRSSTAPPSQRA